MAFGGEVFVLIVFSARNKLTRVPRTIRTKPTGTVRLTRNVRYVVLVFVNAVLGVDCFDLEFRLGVSNDSGRVGS